MFEHVPINRRRRALLGAAGALVFQRVLQPMTASSQTTPGSKVKIGVIGAGHIGGTLLRQGGRTVPTLEDYGAESNVQRRLKF